MNLFRSILVTFFLGVASFGALAAEGLSDSFNRSALAVFNQAVAQAPMQNLVISPLSIGLAMEMAAMGARGETQDEMRQVLHNSLTSEQTALAAKSLLDELSKLDEESSVSLQVANALMIKGDKNELDVAYSSHLNDHFAAQLFDGGIKLETINDWVRKKTGGQITKLLDSLPPNVKIAILNSINLKADWIKPFDSENTRARPFYSPISPEGAPVESMRQLDYFALVQGPGFRVISLPYSNKDLEMVVLLPDRMDGLEAIRNSLTVDGLESLFSKLDSDTIYRNPQVSLSLPKFKLVTKAQLVETFKDLGMSLAFEKADFSGMLPKVVPGELYIQQITHQSVLKVDEIGTEASAATAVIMATRAGAPDMGPLTEFNVDHPFMVIVRHKPTNAMLFVGQVTQP